MQRLQSTQRSDRKKSNLEEEGLVCNFRTSIDYGKCRQLINDRNARHASPLRLESQLTVFDFESGVFVVCQPKLGLHFGFDMRKLKTVANLALT